MFLRPFLPRTLAAALLLVAAAAPAARADRVEADGESEFCDGNSNPDPHFTTFDRTFYDYHGGCDLILVQNSLLDLHIRTDVRSGWSDISNVALRIGGDIFEVDSVGTTYIDKAAVTLVEGDNVFDDIKVVMTTSGTYGGNTNTQYTVYLTGPQYIRINKWYGSLQVSVMNAHVSDFGDSVGMLGTWGTPGKVMRDGSPSGVLPGWGSDDAFGEEWAVIPATDPDLFATPGNQAGSCLESRSVNFGCDREGDLRGLQGENRALHNECCDCVELQEEGGGRRRLCVGEGRRRKLHDGDHDGDGEADDPCLNGEIPVRRLHDGPDPVEACANITDQDLNRNCQYDVLVTWDTEDPTIWATAPWYTDPDPALAPICSKGSSKCEDMGGRCVWRCDDSQFECIPDLCEFTNSFIDFLEETTGFELKSAKSGKSGKRKRAKRAKTRALNGKKSSKGGKSGKTDELAEAAGGGCACAIERD